MDAMTEHLAAQNEFWRTHDRTENTPTWDDLTPEEQTTTETKES